MKSPKILIYARCDEPADQLNRLEARGCRISFGDPQWVVPGASHEADFARAIGDFDILMGTSMRATPMTRRVLEHAGHLRLIAKYTVGVDDIDIAAATELGIMVCHAPTEDNCFAVAENAMALMLAILKKVMVRHADVHAGRWRHPGHVGTYLGARASDGYPGITIGIVGLGRVGIRLAQLLAPWRVRLIGYDPHIPPMNFLLAGVQSVDYRTLLRESDVISYHVTLTSETRNMCGAAELAQMKPNCVVINTARGGVVDENALASALRDHKIAAAAIDAFTEEPLAASSPLRDLGDRLLLSPHATAFTGIGELRAGVEWAFRTVHKILSEEMPDNVYNREVIPTWRKRFSALRTGS
jgi:phosphoglycerate dehydrogenase-like enzyme